jgi:nucleotide-binding universal stress UspA family protein
MSVEFKKILCAVDFSEFSELTLHYGAGLALRFGALFLVFHSVQSSHDDLYGPPLIESAEERKKLLEEANGKIARLMRRYSIAWEPVVRLGDPVDELTNVLREQQVDLIVSCSHGFSGLKRILLGTVVERMARSVSCPLLVVRMKRGPKGEFKEGPLELRNILIGYDLSEDSNASLRYACRIANEFRGVLHLVYSVEAPLEDLQEMPYGEAQEAMLKRLHERLMESVPQGSIEPRNLKSVLLQETPGEAMLSYSSLNAVDLIVVGVRRHGILHKMLMGSTTEALLRRASCPVLVIPQGCRNS